MTLRGIGHDRERYLAVWHSADHGKTWLPPTLIPNSFEAVHRQILAVDSSRGKFHGRVYLTGTGVAQSLDGEKDEKSLSVFHSSDNGETFHGPVKRSILPPRSLVGHVTSVVLSDGTLISLFGELLTSEDALLPLGHTNALLRVVTSHDGGDSFTAASTVSNWAMDLTAAASHAPMLAVDPGSKYFRDRLYAVWPDRRSGRVQILLSVSEDNGQEWSAPHIVNDDGPFGYQQQGPDDFMPAIAVNSAGVVGVVWCDCRDNKDDLGWSMRFAASVNGGRTFAPSVKIPGAGNVYEGREMWPLIAKTTGAGSNPASPDGLLELAVGVHPFYSVGGDYIGMAADSSGDFHPVWADNHTGVPQVWTAAIDVPGEGIPHGSAILRPLRDISAQATLEVEQLSFDRQKSLVTMRAQIKNTSKEMITGPLKILLFSLGSELGQVEVVGADNGERHAGAVWDFTDRLAGNKLAPGQTSQPKLLYFHFTGLRPIREGVDVRFGLVNLEAQVLAH